MNLAWYRKVRADYVQWQTDGKKIHLLIEDTFRHPEDIIIALCNH